MGSVEKLFVTGEWPMKVSIETNSINKFEQKNAINFMLGEIPMEASNKTTRDDSGVKNTTSVGPKVGIDANEAKVDVSAQAVYSIQTSGATMGTQSAGIKVGVDATFVSQPKVIARSQSATISSQNQTKIGGSLSRFLKW